MPHESNEIGQDSIPAIRWIEANTNGGAAYGAEFWLRKTNGVLAAKTAVASGHIIGSLNIGGYDGSNFKNIASIVGGVDTFAGANDMSGYLSLQTRPDGSSAVLVERLKIAKDGAILFKGLASAPATPGGYGSIYYDSTLGAFVFNPALPTGGGSGSTDTLHVVDETDEFLNFGQEDGELGDLGWHFTGGGTTSVGNSDQAVADHPGIISLHTGATTNNTARMHLGNKVDTVVVSPSELDRMVWIVQIQATPINNMNFRMGLCSDFSTVSTGGIDVVCIDYTASVSPNWRCFTRKAGTETRTTTTVPVNALGWYKLEIVRTSGGDFQFYINDVLVATHSTNQPIVMLNVGVMITNSTGADKILIVDYFRMKTKTLGNRYT